MLVLLLVPALLVRQQPAAQDAPVIRQVSPTGITHGVLAMGADTFIFKANGDIAWTYPRGTRDGWMLPNGDLWLDVTKSDDYPGGGVVRINRAGTVLFEYRGTQSEVDTVQPLPRDHVLVTESGPNPRLMELDKAGKPVVEFPLQCQKNDFHMQTRMARKLKNGHYLVPHLLDFAVREYTPEGKVVWEAKTPGWPFQAIRLDNGNTLISCTRANTVVEVDKTGKIVWQITNDDLPGAPLSDCCGIQRLPNGHTIIESYGAAAPDAVKMIEVTPEKKIVWTLYTGRPHGIHEFQILDADGNYARQRLMR